MPTSAAPFPAAEGVRPSWESLPGRVRSAIEEQLGFRVHDAITRRGGFSPGLAASLQGDAGQRAFVKAVGRSPNLHSPKLHRREARIAGALPAGLSPRLRWSLDDGDWVSLGFDDIDGVTPRLPWSEPDLERVLSALGALADSLSPSPVDLESPGEVFGDDLTRWREFTSDAVALRGLAPQWRDHLGELIELESRWPAAARGTSLVHLDVRADNILMTPDRVYFVDWPWAAVGAAWLDLAALLPSVAMQGGPAPEDVWATHPLGRGVDDEALDCFLAALAGMFTRQALRPPPPGLPTLRSFQAGQGLTARAWLARRRCWPDAIGH